MRISSLTLIQAIAQEWNNNNKVIRIPPPLLLPCPLLVSLQHMCYGHCAERSLSVAADTHDGPVGAHRLYQSPAQVVIYAPTHLSVRSTPVSIKYVGGMQRARLI